MKLGVEGAGGGGLWRAGRGGGSGRCKRTEDVVHIG